MGRNPRSTGGASVVVPVLNAARYIGPLLEALSSQQPSPPGEIILVDSRSTDGTLDLAGSCPLVRTLSIEEFSHGAARNLGASAAAGEFVIFMSQDALPANTAWLRSILEPFRDEAVAASYSRQLPYPDASPMERFFLETHFPHGPKVRGGRAPGGAASGAPGLADVFFSNVSSAVRRSLLPRFPFDEELIMSEDQQLSRDLIEAGYKVAYQPESVVYHSHRYTLREVFRRYFDSAYSLTVIFRDHGLATSFGIGSSYFLREMRHMARNHPLWLPYYLCYMAAKAGGTVAGHAAEVLPAPLARRLSFHRYHWARAARGGKGKGGGEAPPPR